MVATAGGGGWGDPLERPPERVALDVAEELVTIESAAADYGVAIDARTGALDAAATESLRGKMRAARGAKA